MRYFALKNAFNLDFVFVKLMSVSIGKFETFRPSKKWLGEGKGKKRREGKVGATGLQLQFSLSMIRKNKTPSPGLVC